MVIKNGLGVEPLELRHMKQLAMHHQVTKLHSMGRTLLKLNYFHQRLKYVLLHQEQNTTPVVRHVLD